MITNSSITIYHKSGLDEHKNIVWTKYIYNDTWYFGGKGASINKGYDNANDVEIRIPYKQNTLNITNFAIGDIIVKGTLDVNITKQSDLKDYDIYNITSIKDNNFGNNPHIHIGGK